jgi:hypothetical protein
VFRPNGLEVTRELRKFNDQELHNSSISAKNIKMIKSSGMKTVGHLSFMWEKILWGNLRQRDNLEDQGENLRIVVIHAVNKYVGST